MFNRTSSRATSGPISTVHKLSLPDHVLPKNSTQTLKFGTLKDAEATTVNRQIDWVGVQNDDSIHKTDDERRAWVLRLLLAMKDRDNILEQKSERWDEYKDYFYREEDTERVFWSIVDMKKSLHRHDPAIFSIYDP